MNSKTLFPCGIRVGLDTVGADALDVLTAGIHLNRRNARRIGWRGLRPCMTTGYAWTMRTVGREGVYGLAFLGEDRDAACLYARFSVFYFPNPDESVLATYLSDARRAAAAPDYFADIREFTLRETSDLFFLGLLGLNVRLDLQGLSLFLEVPARHRIVAVDGIAGESVAEGGRACNVPSLRLAVPFIRLLALSAASLLESRPDWSVTRMEYPVRAFTADGDWGTIEGETLPGCIFFANFGAPVTSRPGLSALGARPLTGKAFALKEPEFEDSRPVLHVVSGFLGSGKTTFLSEWLAWLHNHDRHTAVLQNELGEKNLDSTLLKYETVSESLDEGCVCCTLADSLRPGVRRLLGVLPTEQIILETTGVANPGAVRDALDDLSDMIRPGLFISLVDALDSDNLLAHGLDGPPGLAGEQIRRAGVLVCNKIEMVSPERLARITDILHAMNPNATIFNASHGRIPFGELNRLAERADGPASKAEAAFRPRMARHVTHRDEGYESLVVTATKPMDAASLTAFIRLVRDRAPRVKGVIDSVEENCPMVVQYAAGALTLEKPFGAPGAERFLVLIGKNFDAAFKGAVARFPGLKG